MTEQRAAELAGELRVVVSELIRGMREQTGEGNDLTKSQSSVLGRIERDGPITATELARAQGMRPQSMGPIVAALEAAGLISGSPDPRDGRKTMLSLTDRAREDFRTGRLARQDWLATKLTVALSDAELEQLAVGLALLKRVTQA